MTLMLPDITYIDWLLDLERAKWLKSIMLVIKFIDKRAANVVILRDLVLYGKKPQSQI
jgi:hypothetical protein